MYALGYLLLLASDIHISEKTEAGKFELKKKKTFMLLKAQALYSESGDVRGVQN